LAKLVDFEDVVYQNAIDEARSKPLFAHPENHSLKIENKQDSNTKLSLKQRKERAIQLSKDRLQKDLQRTTRQKIDPFLLENNSDGSTGGNIWLKKKRHHEDDIIETDKTGSIERDDKPKDDVSSVPSTPPYEGKFATTTLGLVDYDSDS